MKDFWEQRYAEDGFAYGLVPNEFLVSQAEHLQPGLKVLVVGDGEGRNGVWLAEQGLKVTTVDYSGVAVKKSQQLAQQRGVEINALCEDLLQWFWPENEYDVVVPIYLHFPSAIRPSIHAKMLAALKPGGKIVMEAFNKDQLDYPSGGPPEKDMLFAAKDLAKDFAEADILNLEERVVPLNEGKYHVGPGAVVRLIARKRVS